MNKINRAASLMTQYGGSFSKHLGNALLCADQENTDKIMSVFGEHIYSFLRFDTPPSSDDVFSELAEMVALGQPEAADVLGSLPKERQDEFFNYLEKITNGY